MRGTFAVVMEGESGSGGGKQAEIFKAKTAVIFFEQTVTQKKNPQRT